ncbi:MAG: sigma-70 family RNA polymerase sigma factor [Planctomycetes bacterium]|nr:sigma-70 family RNA polymerase sigma factor [Planctomycetota bacterium]
MTSEPNPDAGSPSRPDGSRATLSPLPAGVRSDAELLRATAAGDRDAFRTLVDRYERRAFYAAHQLLGDEEEARDVVQEAFVRVYRSLDKYDERRPFYTWFYRIVTNLAIDHHRHLKLTKRITTEEVTESLPGGIAPAAPVESEEVRRHVRAALETLPPKFKSVMVLRELHGLSCKEIAEIVGSTHATVRWRMHRARLLFKDAYERLFMKDEQKKTR